MTSKALDVNYELPCLTAKEITGQAGLDKAQSLTVVLMGVASS